MVEDMTSVADARGRKRSEEGNRWNLRPLQSRKSLENGKISYIRKFYPNPIHQSSQHQKIVVQFISLHKIFRQLFLRSEHHCPHLHLFIIRQTSPKTPNFIKTPCSMLITSDSCCRLLTTPPTGLATTTLPTTNRAVSTRIAAAPSHCPLRRIGSTKRPTAARTPRRLPPTAACPRPPRTAHPEQHSSATVVEESPSAAPADRGGRCGRGGFDSPLFLERSPRKEQELVVLELLRWTALHYPEPAMEETGAAYPP